MERDELEELHYITPLANIRSICQRGIFSHKQAQRIKHVSIAMAEIQERRDIVVVPKGLPLHDYVNLYFSARNPMLFKKKDAHLDLAVLRIKPEIIDLPGVVITDKNAAGTLVRFADAPRGLRIVNRELTFAEFWNSDDVVEKQKRKLGNVQKCSFPILLFPALSRVLTFLVKKH